MELWRWGPNEGPNEGRRPCKAKVIYCLRKPIQRTNQRREPRSLTGQLSSSRVDTPIVDAQWWLVNAGGDVKTILLISINRERQALHLERWCLAPPYDRPVTRNTPSMVPTKTGEVDIVAGNPRPYSRTISVVPY